MANNILASMAVQISANTAEFNKALSQTNKGISSFTSSVKNAVGALGLAFGAQQIASFTIDIAKLAGEAEAVEAAFRRLPNASKLMVDLKEATGNTVSELELMKRTVQASNFDISLAALPRLLEFATLRAQQTGQSVDYLVDSIVTGIGRKSKLILDNLGISATQLSAEFNGASLEAQNVGAVTEAVGRIAERNLKNMAGFSQNTATSIQQLSAAWEDLKVTLGDFVNRTGISSFIKELSSTIKFFSGDFTLTEKEVNKLIFALNELREAAKLEGDQEAVIKYTKGIADLTSQYNLLKNKPLEETNQKLTEQFGIIENIEKQIKEFQEAQKKSFNPVDILDYTKKIEDLKTKIQDLTTGTFQGHKLEIIPDIGGATDALHKMFIKLEDGTTEYLTSTEALSKNLEIMGLNALTAGQAVIQLEDANERLNKSFKKSIDISALVAGGVSDIAAAFGDAVIAGNGDFGKKFLLAVAKFAQQFGSLLIATGISLKALESGNPYLMVAAGVALVAIGAAMSAVLQNKPKMGAGGGSSGGSSFAGSFYRPTINGSSFQDVNVTGEFVIQGSSLVAVLDSANASNGRRRA